MKDEKSEESSEESKSSNDEEVASSSSDEYYDDESGEQETDENMGNENKETEIEMNAIQNWINKFLSLYQINNYLTPLTNLIII